MTDSRENFKKAYSEHHYRIVALILGKIKSFQKNINFTVLLLCHYMLLSTDI